MSITTTIWDGISHGRTMPFLHYLRFCSRQDRGYTCVLTGLTGRASMTTPLLSIIPCCLPRARALPLPRWLSSPPPFFRMYPNLQYNGGLHAFLWRRKCLTHVLSMDATLPYLFWDLRLLILFGYGISIGCGIFRWCSWNIHPLKYIGPLQIRSIV